MNSFALLGYENGKADAMSARPFDATPPEHLTGKAATQSYIQGYHVGYQEVAPTTGAISFKKVVSTAVDPLGLAKKAKSLVTKKPSPKPQPQAEETPPVAVSPMMLVRSEAMQPASEPSKSWWAKNWWIPAVAGGVVVVGVGAAYYLRKK